MVRKLSGHCICACAGLLSGGCGIIVWFHLGPSAKCVMLHFLQPISMLASCLSSGIFDDKWSTACIMVSRGISASI